MAAGAGVVAGGGWRSAFECFLLKRDMGGWEWGEQNDEKDEMEKKAEENKEIRGQKRGSAHGRVLLCWAMVVFISSVSRSRRLPAYYLLTRVQKKKCPPYKSPSHGRFSCFPCDNMALKRRRVHQIDCVPSHKKGASNDNIGQYIDCMAN